MDKEHGKEELQLVCLSTENLQKPERVLRAASVIGSVSYLYQRAVELSPLIGQNFLSQQL